MLRRRRRRRRRRLRRMRCTHEEVRLSLDHFLIWDSLLMRKIPFPWAFPHGFMIHVVDGLFRNSSTNRL